MKAKKKGKPPAIPEHIVRKMIAEAETRASRASAGLSLTMMLSVLLDRFGMEDQIRDVFDAFNERAASVEAGETKLHEWRNVLEKEYRIRIKI